jgi:hypothetical protein
MNVSEWSGRQVTARRAGWDEQLPPDSDLEPYDAPDDDLAGELEVREVGGQGGVPRYTQFLVAGNPADPRTIRPVREDSEAGGAFAEDVHGIQHKGKGPGGGQFVKKGQGGGGNGKEDEVRDSEKKTVKQPPMAAARPQLTDEEDSALEHYTASAWINDELRGLPLRPEAEMFSPERMDEVRKNLASAFAKVKPMAKPIAVHRGLYFDSDEQRDSFLKSLQPGSEVAWKGYTSTSPSESAAKGYMDKHGVRLHIYATKGLDLTHYGHGDSGGEFVLPNDSKLIVNGIKKENGETVITLTQRAAR